MPTDVPGALGVPTPDTPGGGGTTARSARGWRSRIPEETGRHRGAGRAHRVHRHRQPIVSVQPKSLLQLLSNGAFIGMLAVGMVFVVAIRDIDLSIGWIFNFSAVISAKAMVAGIEPFLAALIGIAFGAMLGTINGVLAVRLRIPVIIITLGHVVGVPRAVPRRQ